MIKNFLSRIFPPKEIVKPFPVPEYVVFNITNFNNWFNAKDNGAVYAHSGIFLRLDKLSENHILDYIEKCYGIEAGGPFLWSKPVNCMISKFYDEIRADWKVKLLS